MADIRICHKISPIEGDTRNLTHLGLLDPRLNFEVYPARLRDSDQKFTVQLQFSLRGGRESPEARQLAAVDVSSCGSRTSHT